MGTNTKRERDDAWDGAVTLENGVIQVAILPNKGCDVFELRDLRSGINVLAKTRLELTDLQTTRHWRDSAEAWLSQYLGGWQLILPNGGNAAIVDGVEWGFHGEASTLRWTVEGLSSATLQASVRLTCAPIHVQRRFEIVGRTLQLHEQIRNESAREQPIMWAQHPAFGAPFLDETCLISTGATVVTADDVSPGTSLSPGSVHHWPKVTDASGSYVHLDAVPKPGSGVACLAYLSDFEKSYFAITNPTLGIGAAFMWPKKIFPVAWYWIEAGATEGFPWFGEHYTLAIEPATSAPAQGMNELVRKGGSPFLLGPHEVVDAEFEVTIFEESRRVVDVSPGGIIEFESDGAHD